jgi:hypothetical protein
MFFMVRGWSEIPEAEEKQEMVLTAIFNSRVRVMYYGGKEYSGNVW